MQLLTPGLEKFLTTLLSKVGVPYYFNINRIYALAMELATQGFAKRSGLDKVRVLRLHVDKQPDFITMFSYINAAGEQRFVLFKGQESLAVGLPKHILDKLEFVDAGTFDPNAYEEVVSGRLSVPGAILDTMRGIEFDIRNMQYISAHALSIDTHGIEPSVFDTARYVARYDYTFPVNNPDDPDEVPYTVRRGEHPRDYTAVTAEMIWHKEKNANGLWWPVLDQDENFDYGQKLKEKRGTPIVTWPRHCTRFTPGQSIDQAVWACIVLHALLRRIEPLIFMKGLTRKSEYYGILGPEVIIAGDTNAQMNLPGLQLYTQFDIIIIDGQAGSHCVLRTVQQLFEYIMEKAPDQISKLIVVKDGVSCIPGYETETEAAYIEMEKRGLRRMTYDQISRHLQELNAA